MGQGGRAFIGTYLPLIERLSSIDPPTLSSSGFPYSVWFPAEMPSWVDMAIAYHTGYLRFEASHSGMKMEMVSTENGAVMDSLELTSQPWL